MARIESRIKALEKNTVPDDIELFGFLFCENDTLECPGCPACDKADKLEKDDGRLRGFVVRGVTCK